jgi:hypothetical protein
VLKAKPFSCATARQHIASQLEAAGVAAWRFDLLPLTASTQVCVCVCAHGVAAAECRAMLKRVCLPCGALLCGSVRGACTS